VTPPSSRSNRIVAGGSNERRDVKARLIVSTILAGGLVLAVGATLAVAGKPGGGATTALYPDLRTVVPPT